MKLAILQMADQGPAESTALMLRTVGYDVYLPNDKLRAMLRSAGCDTVLSPRDLTRGMGYDPVDVPEIGPEAMERCELFCDVKGHRNYFPLVKRWPRLENRILWTRINGGKPEHVVKLCDRCRQDIAEATPLIEGKPPNKASARLLVRSGKCSDCVDHGDEVNPPCPVLTPNLWYRECIRDTNGDGDCGRKGCYCGGRSYAMWPPFVRFDEYSRNVPSVKVDGKEYLNYEQPICLIHNLRGWGYGALIENIRDNLGVACYGAGSPDGLIQHGEIRYRLGKSLAMVHLKSNDAPGYALYEALAAGCPVIVTRRLIWRCRMQGLFIPNETCLVFDRETHDALTPDDVRACTEEVREALDRLKNPEFNRRIGRAGHEQLKKVMWSPSRESDVQSLREFMARNFK